MNGIGWQIFGGQSITYDTIGNPLNYMGTTLEWEHGRELHKYGNYTYTYDANGIRINKSYTSNGTTYNTKYIVDGSRVMRQVWNSASGNYVCDYIYDENGVQLAFGLSKNGGAYEYYFYETNIQGDVVGVYDSNGDVIVRYKYTAYGEITNTPVQSSLLTSDFNQAILFRYRGYIYDSESGFYYLQSRYYDPEVGRFINADAVAYLGANNDLLSYNLYAYCSNNPVMYSDPAGHFIISALIAGAVTSAIVSALVDAAVITAAVVVVGMAVSATIDYVNEYQKQKAEEKENIKQQYDDNSPRIHHIVAKAAYKAEPAREVLKDNEINVVTDTHNLVVIPHRFHKSMHTNRYYEYVNKRIEPCNSKEEVYAALDQLSLEIQTAAATGVIPWA